MGYGGSGLAIDSQGNVWHADRFGSSDDGRLKLIELMASYAIRGEKSATESLVHNLSAQKPGFWNGGSVSVLRPDGLKADFSPVSGNGLGGPWAVEIDGNDNVRVSNFTSVTAGSYAACEPRPVRRGQPPARRSRRQPDTSAAACRNWSISGSDQPAMCG